MAVDLIHDGTEEVEKVVAEIEKKVVADPATLPPAEGTLRLHVQKETPLRDIWHAMAYDHRERSILSFCLMVTQAFFYNAVLFTYGLVLLRYYQSPSSTRAVHLRAASSDPLCTGSFP